MIQSINQLLFPGFFLEDLPTFAKFAFGIITLGFILKTSKWLLVYTTYGYGETRTKTNRSFSFENRSDTSVRETLVSAKTNRYNATSPQEPPIVSHVVPFLGHLFGLFRNQMKYYARISNQHKLPIYTLPVPGLRIYVVNSPELITAVQKEKTITFEPIETKLAKRLFNPSASGGDTMTANANPAKGERGLYLEGLERYHDALLPGKSLDQMNRIAVQNIAASCDKLDVRNYSGSGETSVSVKLMRWLRHEIFMASTNAVYGPKNPFKDPNIEAAFWDFERSIGTLLINICPSLTARKGYLGRELLTQKFTKYLSDGDHEEGSFLMKTRHELGADYDLSLEDRAKFEIGTVLALAVSTIPSAFWMLYYVFSNSKLLEILREEVAACLETTTVNDNMGKVTRTLDIVKLRTACPILTSTFKETLRHAAMGASLRLVTEDTIINEQYFLRKNSIIQIPAHVVHSDPVIWGPTVADFDESRFIPSATKEPVKSANKRGIRKGRSLHGALRPFGGGKNLCPGRHFATTEILALTSMMIMRYNLAHQEHDKQWTKPKSERSSLAAVIREPDEDVEVKVSPRGEFREDRWAFRLEESQVIFAIDDDVDSCREKQSILPAF